MPRHWGFQLGAGAFPAPKGVHMKSPSKIEVELQRASDRKLMLTEPWPSSKPKSSVNA